VGPKVDLGRGRWPPQGGAAIIGVNFPCGKHIHRVPPFAWQCANDLNGARCPLSKNFHKEFNAGWKMVVLYL
jgi:hypothetical protein